MPKIIAFMSAKGGCGATFVCAGIWYSLAKKKLKTLALDLRGEKSALDYALGFQNDSVMNISDVMSGECSAQQALCSSEEFEGSGFIRSDSETKIDFELLKSKLDNLPYDYVLIDVSEKNIAAASEICDKFILVTDCSVLSVRMCEKASDILDFDKSFIVINKIIPSYIKNKILITADEVIDGIGLKPIGLIPWSAKAISVSNVGIASSLGDLKLIKSLDNTALRICDECVPAIDFENYYDCFRIKKRR